MNARTYGAEGRPCPQMALDLLGKNRTPSEKRGNCQDKVVRPPKSK